MPNCARALPITEDPAPKRTQNTTLALPFGLGIDIAKAATAVRCSSHRLPRPAKTQCKSHSRVRRKRERLSSNGPSDGAPALLTLHNVSLGFVSHFTILKSNTAML